MAITRSTRSSVLGKRSHQSLQSATSTTTISRNPSITDTAEPLTPESTPNPKRPRRSATLLGDDSNKENIAPLRLDPVNANDEQRQRRISRRASTDSVSSTRSRTSPRPRLHRSSTGLPSPPPSTPTATLARLDLSTPLPSPPSSLVPIEARARALLRSTSNGSEEIAGRDTERTIIHDFLAPFIYGQDTDADKINTTLFISGAPGTGKTALVNSVIGGLEMDAVRILSINCVSLGGLDAVWERLADELGGTKKPKKAKGREAVEKLISSQTSKCLLVLDELDHISRSQQSLNAIFELARAHTSIRIIGIANTHTLLASSTSVSSLSPDVLTLHFTPYEPAQLLTILHTRLASLTSVDDEATKKFLPLPTLNLLTKKIASQTGDVRSLFEVLRGAIDVASSSASPDADPLNKPSPVVTPAHILAALKTHAPTTNPSRSSATSSTSSNSETVVKVRNLSLHARLVLLALVLASKRLSSNIPLLPSSPSARTSLQRTPSSSNVLTTADVDSTQLHAYYGALLSSGGNSCFTPVSRSEFSDLLGVLETVGLVTLSSFGGAPSTPGSARTFKRTGSFSAGKAKTTGQEVRLVGDARVDEVLRGLGVQTDGAPAKQADAKEEEVNGIWQRESIRISREVRTREFANRKNSHSQPDTFDGSFED